MAASTSKTTDDNDPKKPIRLVKAKNVTEDLPPDLAKSVSRILGINMTYDGHIVAAAPGAIFLLDRDLNVKGTITFPGEAVDNGVAVDEKGIYVVTSVRMLKLVWTGTKLSYDEADGGWQSEYNTMNAEESAAAGALSRGSGTTPTLMGFGNDPDKLVVISDADKNGANLVAFWRDQIPAGFKQKPGTKSARIADQIRIDFSKLTLEVSPQVLGYGVTVINSTYPKPAGDIWGNAMTAGLTRPAPLGMQKLTWNPETDAFVKSWTNKEVDNTDLMVPVISAKTGMIYAAHKVNGDYQYVGLDWRTGEVKARWLFPDDSRVWNAFGSTPTLLEDGDLLLGGFFAIKRVNVGDGNKTKQKLEGRDAARQSDALGPGGDFDFDQDVCELYNINEDPAETNDLAAKNPQKLEELKKKWDEEAVKYNVYPLYDDVAKRLANVTAIFGTKSNTFTYYPPGAEFIAEATSPPVKNRSHTIMASVETDGRTDGVITACGGYFASHRPTKDSPPSRFSQSVR